MLAIKLARAATGRSRLAKFEGFYHGYYDYVQVSYASAPADWGPADAPARRPAPAGWRLRAGRGADPALQHHYAVARLLQRTAHELAALIVDPLSNPAGFPLPDATGFLDFLRQITRDYGILLIYDEGSPSVSAFCGAQGRYGGSPT